MRPLSTTLAVVGAAAAATGTVLIATADGSADAASATPARTVVARLITTQPGTLAAGSRILRVNARRTYFGNSFGISLGRDRQGATYPVQTGNGGRSWHTDGPALFLPTADAPLAVTTVSGATKSLQYAFGGGGQVVDVTREGGPQWRGALFAGTVVGVVPGEGRNTLIAFVHADASSGPVYQYVTRNGGLSWRYTPGLVTGT